MTMKSSYGLWSSIIILENSTERTRNNSCHKLGKLICSVTIITAQFLELYNYDR